VLFLIFLILIFFVLSVHAVLYMFCTRIPVVPLSLGVRSIISVYFMSID